MGASVQIKLYGALRARRPANADAFPIETGATIGSIIAELEIPPEKVNLVFINGVQSDCGASVAPGDTVGVFPALGGG